MHASKHRLFPTCKIYSAGNVNTAKLEILANNTQIRMYSFREVIKYFTIYRSIPQSPLDVWPIRPILFECQFVVAATSTTFCFMTSDWWRHDCYWLSNRNSFENSIQEPMKFKACGQEMVQHGYSMVTCQNEVWWGILIMK